VRGPAGPAGPPPPATADDHAMQFRESLTITSVSDGVYTYQGHATLLGRVTAFSFPDGSFTKGAADGDQIFGQLHPATATTGSLTFNGGTREFAHASRPASSLLSTDPKTGATHRNVAGTLSFGADHDEGDRDGRKAHPFAINSGGPAPEGIALAPFVKVPHSATGTASFLGHYTGSGTFEHDPLVIDPSTC